MNSTSNCNTKLQEKDTYRKCSQQPKSILFKLSFYKKQIHSVQKLEIFS